MEGILVKNEEINETDCEEVNEDKNVDEGVLGTKLRTKSKSAMKGSDKLGFLTWLKRYIIDIVWDCEMLQTYI